MATPDIDSLEKNFVQLCQNAQAYNEKASLIYLDSIEMQNVSAASCFRNTTAAAEAAASKNNYSENDDDVEASDEEVATSSV